MTLIGGGKVIRIDRDMAEVTIRTTIETAKEMVKLGKQLDNRAHALSLQVFEGGCVILVLLDRLGLSELEFPEAEMEAASARIQSLKREPREGGGITLRIAEATDGPTPDSAGARPPD